MRFYPFLRQVVLATTGLLVAASSALGNPRLFLVPAGEDPANYPSGTTVINLDSSVVAAGGVTVTLEVFLQETSPVAVRGYQIVLDDATGGSTGSVDYDPIDPMFLDNVRSDYLFAGAAGVVAEAVDSGPPARLATAVADAEGDSVTVDAPVYLGEIRYHVSSDALGSFHINFVNPGIDPNLAKTFVSDAASALFTVTADGAQIRIVGDNIPSVSDWGIVCLALVILVAGSMLIRRDRRPGVAGILMAATVMGGATLAPRWCHAQVTTGCGLYGDVDGNSFIDIDDVDCVVAAFGGDFATCSLEQVDIGRCEANSVVDLFDIFAVLDALQGTPTCDNACFEPGVWEPPPYGFDERPLAGDTNPLHDVYGFSGEFHLSAVDMTIPGRGLDFVWTRRYRSRAAADAVSVRGWDFGMKKSVARAGAHVILSDGNSRRDLFERQADGTWANEQFFRVLVRNPDDSYSLTFAHGDQWHFAPLDGSPAEGKISSIEDRNGNALSFEYDPAGRLTLIGDTLDSTPNPRKITIGYDGNGHLATVSDWTGRQVRYDYYDGIEPGGSLGDLKSVTTPAVVGTPTFNDYPTGKTTVYTYSTGFADERLNHNLLTITDPKGQTWLNNEYDTVTDPSDLNFDRIRRQTLGSSATIIDAFYEEITPSVGNNFAVLKLIVNDRLGNVSEHYYDAVNNLAMIQHYTGRAIPNQPTTDTANRPGSPLRPTDPPLYETRYEYDLINRLTRTVAPNLNDEVLTYDATNPDPRSRGNLTQHRLEAGPLGGNPTSIDETYEYDNSINRVTRFTNGRGHATTYDYDSVGNLTRIAYANGTSEESYEYNAFGQVTVHLLPDNGAVGGQRRRDEFSYHSSGTCQEGYLEEIVGDAPGHGLSTTYEYDCLGRLTRFVDPNAHDVLYTYNSLDQIVRVESPEVPAPAGAIRYPRTYYYDGNDNLVRQCIQDVDDQGTANPDPGGVYITTLYEYDSLNRLTRSCRESGSHDVPLNPPKLDCGGLPDSAFITELFEYDANGNLTRFSDGESAEGRQPTNQIQQLYDERDLLFSRARAPGDASQSTTRYDYDANGNLTKIGEGIESNPRDTSYAYDGYNRRTTATDAMGNATSFAYDATGRITAFAVSGELTDIPGGTGNVPLAGGNFTYDAVNRLTSESLNWFDRQSQAAIDDGAATTQYFYSDNFQLARRVDDRGNATSYAYDSANRLTLIGDSLGNETTYAYDSVGSITQLTELHKSTLGNPDETYATTYEYDSLDRLTRIIDPVGNTTGVGYDSRGNLTVETDALNRETRYEYDAINRLTRTAHDMIGAGADPTDPNDIVIGRTWDDSSRLVEQLDDDLNVTTYEYDSLNRLTRTTFPDATGENYAYDVHNNITLYSDANGSVVASAYDDLNRLTTSSISPGAGATFESFSYDGLSNPVRGEDDDSIVTYAYDSLGRITLQGQNLGAVGNQTFGSVASEYDGVGNRTSLVYPGGRVVDTSYDALNRIAAITEPATGLIANYDFIGPERMERMQYGNGTQTTYAYDGIAPNPPGDWGVQQMIATLHVHATTSAIIDERQYAWDARQNKVRHDDVRIGGPQLQHEYVYDPIYRLTRTIVTDPAIGPLRISDYLLDDSGNRTRVTGDNCSGPFACDNTLPEPADCQMHQYTTTPCGNRTYDQNGNLSSIGGVVTLAYDYVNRLIGHQDPAAGVTTTYAYDAFGRRFEKVVAGPTGPTATRYFYDGWQVVEEQDASGATQATYVYGGHLDDPLQMRRDALPPTGIPEDYYYHADDMGNIMALTDAAGIAVERYEYFDYGEPEFSDGSGAPRPSSFAGNPYLFSGRRYDDESGLYHFRTRYLDPLVGRFLSRDSLGVWGDCANVGNGYTYVGNNPWSHDDPFGLARSSKPKEIVVVGSKVKEVVREAGLRSDGELVQALSDKVHEILETAIGRAGATKRSTRLWANNAGTMRMNKADLIDALPSSPRMNKADLIEAVAGRAEMKLPETVISPSKGSTASKKLFVGGLSWDTSDDGAGMSQIGAVPGATAGKKLFVGGLSWHGTRPVGGAMSLHSGSIPTRSKKLFVGGLSFSPGSSARVANGRSTVRPYDLFAPMGPEIPAMKVRPLQDRVIIKALPSPTSSSDKRKQSLYFPETMLEEATGKIRARPLKKLKDLVE